MPRWNGEGDVVDGGLRVRSLTVAVQKEGECAPDGHGSERKKEIQTKVCATDARACATEAAATLKMTLLEKTIEEIRPNRSELDRGGSAAPTRTHQAAGKPGATGGDREPLRRDSGEPRVDRPSPADRAVRGGSRSLRGRCERVSAGGHGADGRELSARRRRY